MRIKSFDLWLRIEISVRQLCLIFLILEFVEFIIQVVSEAAPMLAYDASCYSVDERVVWMFAGSDRWLMVWCLWSGGFHWLIS